VARQPVLLVPCRQAARLLRLLRFHHRLLLARPARRRGKYDLARSEFQDYLKYYGDTDLASNAQFYLGEIAYSQRQYDLAVGEYDKVLTSYPKSFKLAPARLKKGMALIELNQKNAGVKELREVVKRYPGTEEERRARARLKDMGVAVTATTAAH
jgi:tol-pal system protein YbgF